MKMTKILSIAILTTSLIISSGQLFAAPVNINTADAQKLATNLKGIGLSKAMAIIGFRETNGHFTDLASLTGVKGIGEKTVLKNKDDILFQD